MQFSFGIAQYFPDDNRYGHFLKDNPTVYSGQIGYDYGIFGLKAGFDRFSEERKSVESFSRRTAYPPSQTPYDSLVISHGTAAINSSLRATTLRIELVLKPLQDKGICPFVGLGGSWITSKGNADSSLAQQDTFYNNTTGGRPGGYYFIRDSVHVPQFNRNLFGAYLEAGLEIRLPYEFLLIVEAIADFRSKGKGSVFGPVKGGGISIGARLGRRFRF